MYNDSREIARGESALFDVCAEVLLNEPSTRVLGDIQQVAHALGDSRFDRFEESDALVQRYYDRLFVTDRPVFVPLSENCMRGFCMTDAGPQYGALEGSASDHVIACYHAVGFDWHRLSGFQSALDILRADSLASECAFVAFLKSQEACAETDEQVAHIADLADEFIARHLGEWARTAAHCAARSDEDLYATLCAFVADALEALQIR